MLARIDHDLTVANPVGKTYSAGNAQNVRFFKVPSAFEVQIDGGGPWLPVDAPWEFQRCGAPIKSLVIKNVAGSGTAIILLSDGEDQFNDFLASAAAPREVLDTQLVPSNTGAAILDLMKTYADAAAVMVNGSLVNDVALQFNGYRLTSAVGFSRIERTYSGNHVLNRHHPAGTLIRNPKYEPARFLEIDLFCQRQAAAPASFCYVCVGYWNTGAGAHAYGFGFAASAQVSDNWHAAIIDTPGAGVLWPQAVERILWVDLGVSAFDLTLRKLRFVTGVDTAGVPFMEWWIDGTKRHELRGVMGAAFNIAAGIGLTEFVPLTELNAGGPEFLHANIQMPIRAGLIYS